MTELRKLYKKNKKKGLVDSRKARPISRYFLMKEYEIIQKKIDNYGSSDNSYIALVVSVAIAVFIAKETIYSNASILVGIVIVAILLYTQSKNMIYEKRLAERAIALEKALNKNVFFKACPAIAKELSGKKTVSPDEVIDNCFRCFRSLLVYWTILAFLIYLLMGNSYVR